MTPEPPREDIDATIRRLRAQATSHQASAPEPPRGVSLQRVVLLTMPIALLAGGALAFWPSAAGRVVEQVQHAGTRFGSMIERLGEPDAVAAAPVLNDTDVTVRVARPVASRASAASDTETAPAVSELDPSQVPDLAGGLSVLPNRAAAVEPAAITAVRPHIDVVYSSENRDVVPPLMRVPESPAHILRELSRTLDPNGTPPTLELLIDARGVVERAKVHTATPHMLDALVVSRAKTWQFEPARRGGTAVRYRLQLTWEQFAR